MPALLDDPTSPVIYRASGAEPYPSAQDPQIPSSIFPRPITLRDRVTVATLIPFFSPSQVPRRLLSYLCDTLNKEIDGGDTYPMVNPLTVETFGPYWFGNFGAVMVRGDIGGIEAVQEMESANMDWSKVCLGSFYVKPNYPGRSSHVCNGGFLVTPAARNKGVGKSMGECYLDWAPQLGYTYSVFNLVYETNTASTRIWDSLGFKRIGRVPASGNLRSSAELVDAIIYGRDLSSEGEGLVSEERFDKIRYYLKHAKYPTGADRAEKSRLRSAATHYKLITEEPGQPEKLMLKDKEVISDPTAQYEIAREVHQQFHGGINKTTAVIATKYHWVRIKETVNLVLKNCAECKDPAKAPSARQDPPAEISEKIQDNIPTSIPAQSNPSPAETQVTGHRQQVLDESAFMPKANLFNPRSQQMIAQPLPHLAHFSSMAIDPQIMQQLTSQLDPPFQTPRETYSALNLDNFGRHNDPHHNAFIPPDPDSFMADGRVTSMQHDQEMDLVDEHQMGADGQMSQHLLGDAYLDSGGGGRHYKS